MPLPYENATAGRSAIVEMEKVLKRFGAGSFGAMEDFGRGEVIVQFEWRGRRVSLKASIKGYAAAWLKENPWRPTMRTTRPDYEARALARGNIAVWSILRDWLKAQVVAIEIGLLSFDGAFLSALVLPSGETVMERIEATNMLPALAGRKG